MTALQWLAMLANPGPTRGSEQRRLRPVLMVSNEQFNQAMPSVTELPSTSTHRRLYPSEVMLLNGKAGQPLDSIIMAHQIRTISQQRVETPYGFLDDPDIRRSAREATREHLELEL